MSVSPTAEGAVGVKGRNFLGEEKSMTASRWECHSKMDTWGESKALEEPKPPDPRWSSVPVLGEPGRRQRRRRRRG